MDQEESKDTRGTCVNKDLIHSGGHPGQVSVDAGHSELDLVADTLQRTFDWM